MTEQLRKIFFEFLDERKTAVLKESEDLKLEERKDESNTLKAKANIYDIFKALWDASTKGVSDMQEFQTEFMKKATQIPATWEKSLEVAKAHDDAGKIMIEEAKLAAVAEIKEKFKSISAE